MGARIEQRWRRIGATRSVVEVMALVFAADLALSRLLHLPDGEGRYELLIGVAYFVYGLFSAFTIDSSRGRLSRINELLKGGDGDLVSIYRSAAAFGPEEQRRIQDLIDLHMQDQIDFRLVDFDRSAPSLRNLETAVAALDPTSARQEIALGNMVGCLTDVRHARHQLEALVRQRVTAVEWITLLFLLVTLWALMLAASGGPLLASVLGAALISSLAGITMVLFHLDRLTWQEGGWIWRPLHGMFLALDELPYYGRPDLESGRMRPTDGPLRAASFSTDYPDMSGKVVEVGEMRSGRYHPPNRS